jgi:Protein of unknown function (DUF2946)
MLFRRAQQKLVSVIALLVMTFAMLSPSLANALGQSSPVMWVELCSADGMRRVAVDSSGTPLDASQQSATHVSEHCPFCHLEHANLALPPAPVQPQIAPTERADFPARFYTAPRPCHTWAPSRSRGPPALS